MKMPRRKVTNLNACSTATFYRRGREYIEEKRNRTSKELPASSGFSVQSEFDLSECNEPNHTTEGISNEPYLFGCNRPVQADRNESDMSGCNEFEPSDRIQQPESSSASVKVPLSEKEIDSIAASGLMQLKTHHKLSKAVIKSVIDFVNFLSNLVVKRNILPKSYYFVECILKLKDDPLEHSIGFVCKFCKQKVLIKKSEASVCSSCKSVLQIKDLINSDHFFQNNFEKQLKLLLETKPLIPQPTNRADQTINSIFDGAVYRRCQLMSPSRRIVGLTLFSDGVSPSRSDSSSAWPIYIKVHDLDCSAEEKTFLYANYFGDSKPDPNFYLESLIGKLNSMFKDGIKIESSNQTVVPMLIACVFDTPAKSLFLNHVSHTGYYGCPVCDIRGIRKNRHFQLFKPDDTAQLRSSQNYESVLRGEVEPKGVQGRSMLSNLRYLDIYQSLPIDAMHAVFAGVSKRLLFSMLDSSSKSKECYMPKKLREVLSQRISNFGSTSDFKRVPRGLMYLHRWKTNEHFQWLMYLAPICLKNLVSRTTYDHYMVLTYVTSKLWSGGITRELIQQCDELIELFLNDLEQVHDEFEHTFNAHLLTHLVLTVMNFGPLDEINAFFFEHLNGKIKGYIQSAYAKNEQIRYDYLLEYFQNLSKDHRPNCEVKLVGHYRKDGIEFVKNVNIGRVLFSSLSSESKSKSKNFFIKFEDKFYLVSDFIVREGVTYFEGLVIKRLENLFFKYWGQRLELDYITKCEITSNTVVLPFSKSAIKVHFVPKFEEKGSKFEYLRRGHLIELKHLVHN